VFATKFVATWTRPWLHVVLPLNS